MVPICVAAGVGEIGAEDPIAVTDEGIVPVPLIHAEPLSKSSVSVYQGMSSQPMRCLSPGSDLGGTGDVHQRRVPRVQAGRMRDLVGTEEQPTQARSGYAPPDSG